MKKILLSLLALCAATSLWAAKFQSGLLYYNTLSDSTVEVTYRSTGTGNYSDLTAVTIPETVTYSGITYTVVAIGKQAFAHYPTSSSPSSGANSSLKLINIPKTVQTIDNYAFYWCSALTTVNFLGDGLENIGDYAFYQTMGLLSFDFPKTLKTIGAHAFSHKESSGSMYGLSGALIIPNTVTTIGSYAFYRVAGISSVTISNSVSTINNSVFASCSGLTSVTLGNSVATIGESAFQYCTNLTSITLPKSVKTINNSAFASCSKLTTVYLKPTTPPAFTNTNILPSSAKTFYVPCGAADTYYLSDWVTFTTNFQEEDCIKKYTIYVNQDCTSNVVEE